MTNLIEEEAKGKWIPDETNTKTLLQYYYHGCEYLDSDNKKCKERLVQEDNIKDDKKMVSNEWEKLA